MIEIKLAEPKIDDTELLLVHVQRVSATSVRNILYSFRDTGEVWRKAKEYSIEDRGLTEWPWKFDGSQTRRLVDFGINHFFESLDIQPDVEWETLIDNRG